MRGRRKLSAMLGAAGACALGLGLVFPVPFPFAWTGAALLVGALFVALLASADSRPAPNDDGFAFAETAPPASLDRSDADGEQPAELSAQGAAPSGVEPSDALEAFVKAGADVGDLTAAHLWLLDPATRTMRLVTAFGSMRPNAEPLAVDATMVGEAAESGRALLRPEQRRVENGVERTLWRYAVPLKAGETIGCAALDFSSENPDAARLNRAVAMTRGALTGALALHVSRIETEVAHTLLAAARELLELVDPATIVDTALSHAVALSSADTGSIMLLEPGSREMTIHAAIGLPDRIVSTTRVTEGEGIAGWVLTTEKPLVVEDLEDKGPRSRRHGVRSAMAVPICDEAGILGVLNVGSRVFHARFSASQLASLEALGQVLGLALRNASAYDSARELYLETIRALALALETKDPYSRGATDRVHDLAVGLGSAMGLTEAEQQALRVASLLHDIGMAAAGDLSLAGGRPLSTVEWAMLKMHPVIAADVLDQAHALKAAVPIVYHHHEHYDGQGYVLGLAGEQIPLGARVLSVADAYVAMTSSRAYRPAKTHDEAVAELQDEAGSQFDPEVVKALVDLLGNADRSRRGV